MKPNRHKRARSVVAFVCALHALDTSARGMEMHANPIDVTLSVLVVDERITVTARFENRGQEAVLVKMGEYGYGNKENTAGIAGEPGNHEFLVTVGRDQPVAYYGYMTHRAPVTRELFTPMRPGDVIAVKKVRLDGSYNFLPGTHEYQVVHLHMQFDESNDEIRIFRSRPAIFTYTRK